MSLDYVIRDTPGYVESCCSLRVLLHRAYIRISQYKTDEVYTKLLPSMYTYPFKMYRYVRMYVHTCTLSPKN